MMIDDTSYASEGYNNMNKQQQVAPSAPAVTSQFQLPTTSHTIVCAISGVSYQVIEQSGLQGYKISQPIHPMMLPHALAKVIGQDGVAIEYKVGAVLASLHHAKLTAHADQLTLDEIEQINYRLASSLENKDCHRLYEAITRASSKTGSSGYLAMIPKLNLIAILDHKPQLIRGLMLTWLNAINQKHDAETARYIRDTYEQRQRGIANTLGLTAEAVTKLAKAKHKATPVMTATKAETVLAKSIYERAELYPNKDLKSLQKATKQFTHMHERVQAKLLDCFEAAYEIAKTKGMMNKYSPLKAAFIYAIDYLRGEVIPHGEFELDEADLLADTTEGES